MKHVFILNPKSNSETFTRRFREKIENICQAKKIEFEIKTTQKNRDAEFFARESAMSGDSVRIYACGGDGTVNEVVNGIFGFDNVELAVIPIGTGNDFVKTFGNVSVFNNIEETIESESRLIDVIKINDRICINIANIGFDAAVVQCVEKLRKKRFVPKAVSYHLGVALCLIRYPKERLRIKFDDEEAVDEKFLLTLFSNAQFYGGGYRSAALAKVDDGLIDVVTVKNVGRGKFVANVSSYQKGTIFNSKKVNEILRFRRCKHVVITKDEPFTICCDGEMLTQSSAEIECVPKAVRFVVPDSINEKDLNCFS